MAKTANAAPMTKYQFEIDPEKWDAWKDTVPRSKALDERIRELIEADTEGRVREEKDRSGGAKRRDPEPEPAVDDTSPDASDAVDAVVERVSDGWEDDEARLERRRAAARAVLQHAVDSGDAVGKTDAIEQFRDQYHIEGQNEETWWRKNIRPVLKAVGEYSNSRKGYVVEGDDSEEFEDRVDEIIEQERDVLDRLDD